MSYILDDEKNNLGSTIVPIGTDNVVTVLKQFAVDPMANGVGYFNVTNTGDIHIGNPIVKNNLFLNTGVDFNFMQITDTTLTNYTLTQNDYAIEIITDTINTITLPTARNTGGRTYIISRGSNNNNLILQTQLNENIDTRMQISLTRKYVHLKVMSNGQDSWYVV